MISRRTRVSGGSFDVIQLFRSMWNATVLYLMKYAISEVFCILRLFSEKEAERALSKTVSHHFLQTAVFRAM